MRSTTRLIGRTRVLAAVAVAVGLALSACSSSGGGGSKPSIVIGDKNFAEEYVLGHLYAQALEAKGYKVSLKENLGSSEIADKALTSDKIQILPEYTGVIYTELAHLGDRPKSAQATYDGAKKYEEGQGLTILNPTPFQDADGVAVHKAYATEHHLVNVGDLKNVGSFTYGGPPENATRFQGVVGLKQVYGLNNIQFKPLPIGTQYQALDQNKVDSIAIFTTDAQLATGKYTVLKDNEGIFGFQQVVPVISQKLLKAGGSDLSDILNAVSAKLTTDAIIAMNKAVQIDQKKPADVAAAFLKANGLA